MPTNAGALLTSLVSVPRFLSTVRGTLKPRPDMECYQGSMGYRFAIDEGHDVCYLVVDDSEGSTRNEMGTFSRCVDITSADNDTNRPTDFTERGSTRFL